jgi:hypothetical protein
MLTTVTYYWNDLLIVLTEYLHNYVIQCMTPLCSIYSFLSISYSTKTSKFQVAIFNHISSNDNINHDVWRQKVACDVMLQILINPRCRLQRGNYWWILVDPTWLITSFGHNHEQFDHIFPDCDFCWFELILGPIFWLTDIGPSDTWFYSVR